MRSVCSKCLCSLNRASGGSCTPTKRTVSTFREGLRRTNPAGLSRSLPSTSRRAALPASSARGICSSSILRSEVASAESVGESSKASPAAVQEDGVPAGRSDTRVSAWTSIGIPTNIVDNLLKLYPHIRAPTPAQLAFLLSIFRGRDVYLKDSMGRGKTLAIALAALTLVHRFSVRSGQVIPTPRILILVPTPHLITQIESDLLTLSPIFTHYDEASSTTSSSLFSVLETHEADPQPNLRTPIILTTPKNLASHPSLPIEDIKLVLIDEPDSMVPSLPSRSLKGKDLAKHRINVHPPPLVQLMNRLFGIQLDEKAISKKGKLSYKVEGERNIQTVWSSGSLTNDFRRFVRTRSWVRGDNLVDLDFTETASPRQIEERQNASRIPRSSSQVTTTDVVGLEPYHYAIVVHRDGSISSLASESTSVPSRRDRRSITTSHHDTPERLSSSLSDEIVESMALIHSASPPPPGSFALAVPPERVSLDKLSYTLETLGIPTTTLTTDLLQAIQGQDLPESESAPLYLARRSNIPGLHMDQLHTVYLLDGLDMAGLPPSQQNRKGRSDRMAFYGILAGRIGRLGTSAQQDLRPSGADGAAELDGARQRIITLVMNESEEHEALRRMFFEGTDAADNTREASVSGPNHRSLATWDVGAMYAAIEEIARDTVDEEIPEMANDEPEESDATRG